MKTELSLQKNSSSFPLINQPIHYKFTAGFICIFMSSIPLYNQLCLLDASFLDKYFNVVFEFSHLL